LSQIIKRICLHKCFLIFCFITTGFVIVLEGCITRVEGCLDVAAANFDLSADRSCEDCCTYPLLSVSLSQKWNDRNFSLTDTLFDTQGRPYRISDLKYVLSSWKWQDTDLHSYTVDSAEIACTSGILSYTPDIIIVDAKQSQYTLGTIRQSPLTDSLSLKLGFVADLDCIDAYAAGIPPVFSNQSAIWDSLSASRASIRLVLQRDTSMAVFDTLFIHTMKDISLGLDLDFTPGFPETIRLSVNYALWFSNVDVQDLNSFPVSIENGIRGSFYKTP